MVVPGSGEEADGDLSGEVFREALAPRARAAATKASRRTW